MLIYTNITDPAITNIITNIIKYFINKRISYIEEYKN